jgi:hypothetical protein
MNLVSPLFDASAAGSLANASMCGPSAKKPSPPAEFVASPCAARAANSVACRTKWRRLIDAFLSPISGPRLPRGD